MHCEVGPLMGGPQCRLSITLSLPIVGSVNPFTAKYLLANKTFFHLVKYVRCYDYLECVGQCRHVLSYYPI